VRHAHALHLQLAHSEETVVGGVAEIKHPRERMVCLALGIAPLHRHPATDEAVKLAVVLDKRAGGINVGELLNSLLPRRLRQVRVQPFDGRPQISHQHDIPLGVPPQRAGWA